MRRCAGLVQEVGSNVHGRSGGEADIKFFGGCREGIPLDVVALDKPSTNAVEANIEARRVWLNTAPESVGVDDQIMRAAEGFYELTDGDRERLP